jgi:hypothetical protein
MTLEKKIEKPLNIILKNKYPFIKEIEVYRLTHIFFELLLLYDNTEIRFFFVTSLEEDIIY